MIAFFFAESHAS